MSSDTIENQQTDKELEMATSCGDNVQRRHESEVSDGLEQELQSMCCCYQLPGRHVRVRLVREEPTTRGKRGRPLSA